MRCVIVTGLSGAGRSTALRQLEDMGYFCVDNMPPTMISTFIEMCIKDDVTENAAVVVDTRAGQFFDEIYETIDKIQEQGIECEILFLETSDDILIRRYKESRRKHPMDAVNVSNGIALERKKLSKLRDRAKYVIDTSVLSVRQLSDMLWGMFSSEAKNNEILPVVVSFGFKNGIPIDADLVFDVRFLPNPFYDPALRFFNGLEPKVRDYVFSYEQSEVFMRKLYDMLDFLLPYYKKEGKYQIVIAIGCTGGMHRSVAVAQELYEWFVRHSRRAVIQHRDIDKDLQRG